MEEFDERMNALNTEWEIGGAEMVEFKEYFRKCKEDEFKYHVMKRAVKAAEITVGTTYGYCPLLHILVLRSTTKVLQFVGEFLRRNLFEKKDLLSIWFILDSQPPEPHLESLQFHKVFSLSFAWQKHTFSRKYY